MPTVLGLCDMGPAMAINDRVYTNLTPEEAVELLRKGKVEMKMKNIKKKRTGPVIFSDYKRGDAIKKAINYVSRRHFV